VDIPADLPDLLTDPSTLSRILTELLNNACKYTPPTGVITVTAHRLAEQLVLSINNSGVEIAASERDRIFDKFYRIPNSDPWKHGGTGLGLALVKRLVEQLGGTIQVASSAGQTTFSLQLAIASPPPRSSFNPDTSFDCAQGQPDT
jgi:signal transduction histidine kinase